MTHLYNQPTRVLTGGEGQPQEFTWRNRVHSVAQVVDVWVLQTLWWQGEVHRAYFRVLTPEWGIYDLFRENGQWYVAARLD